MPRMFSRQVDIVDFTDCIAAIGTDRFWESLVAALRYKFPFGSYAVFLYRAGRYESTPSLQVSPDDLSALENYYYKGAYVLSPWYRLVLNGKSGFWTLPEVAPRGVRSGPYYNRYFKPSGIHDECDWVVAGVGDLVAKLSVARYRQEGLFRKHEIEYARTVSPVVQSLVERHLKFFYALSGGEAHGPDAGAKLALFGSGLLTKREKEVTTLMIRGHSVKSCARELDISPETVRIHRKNIYRKTQATSQSELLAQVVAHLISPI